MSSFTTTRQRRQASSWRLPMLLLLMLMPMLLVQKPPFKMNKRETFLSFLAREFCEITK